ncbi:MAG: 23S rRNA (uracil(1939)-C(5))-methyltransferase RlmD [Coriobacteriales bacterium]|jgi:23S rRNA (uracil1939-C5)-methyltransferase|nr:23S rRNA (uracil(1939)-C(5))-methyltransferase RlmD [Coriobacteriales bacterium]
MDEQVEIERLSNNGSGIGHLSSGKIVFVANSAPGDVAKIALDTQKDSFAKGHIVNLVQESPQRVTAPCPLAGTCGGCTWQHIAYDAQLKAKRDSVVDALVRIGWLAQDDASMLVQPIISSKQELGYRNKLEYAAQSISKTAFQLGFFAQGSHTIVIPKTCYLAPKPIADTAKALRGALSYVQGQGALGIYRVGIRYSARTRQTEVALWSVPEAINRSLTARAITDALKSSCSPTSIVRIIAPKNKARATQKVEVLAGNGYWKERLCNLNFFTSAPSFFQVNTEQAEKLVSLALELLDFNRDSCTSLNDSINDGVVADLYAGGGTFSLPLAQAGASVVAVESVSASVKDLRRNAEKNNLNVRVLGGDVMRILPKLTNKYGKLAAVLVDPPRTGLTANIVSAIADAAPKHIVYVSCNPSTFARDVARLRVYKYSLITVFPVDLFPQTPHVELVGLMSRKKG